MDLVIYCYVVIIIITSKFALGTQYITHIQIIVLQAQDRLNLQLVELIAFIF